MCSTLCSDGSGSSDRALGPPEGPPCCPQEPTARKMPLVNVSRCEALSSLAWDFRFNRDFGDKVRALEAMGYRGWRRIRGDGNCFYRAVGFGLLQLLAAQEGARRAAWGAQVCHNLGAVRFEDAACPTGRPRGPARPRPAPRGGRHVGRRRRRGRGGGGRAGDGAGGDGAAPEHGPPRQRPGPCPGARTAPRGRRVPAQAGPRRGEASAGISYEVVCLAQGYGGVEDFCRRVVLPMGTEAEGVVLGALPAALGVGLRVVLLDRRGSKDVPLCDYNMPAGAPESGAVAAPVVHLQLRPGHYDLLYFGEECADGAEVQSEEGEGEEDRR
ncbi:unnamed protein product [Prorocentrum cordatum]|uniref:ubiquitinyl hydrolase 1 n=1 Tax=Prorocentrum cordatum TaxID=2364126 RepID=A0ABN9SQ09_9DINO|nr:unnamed protein product [Polarella glacialis]